MKHPLLRVLSLLLASTPSWVGAQSPMPDHYRAFITHIESAVAHRDLGAIEALYRTNGVAAQELKLEMARWPDLIAGDAKERMGAYFVPSEKRSTASSIEQVGPANGRQPIPSGTDRTSPAVGPRP